MKRKGEDLYQHSYSNSTTNLKAAEQISAVAELELANVHVNESVKTALNENTTIDEIIVQNKELIRETLNDCKIF